MVLTISPLTVALACLGTWACCALWRGEERICAIILFWTAFILINYCATPQH